MSFYTSRIWFLALLLFCVSCAGISSGTTLTFVDDTGKETPLAPGAVTVPSLRGNVRADGVPSNTQSVLFKVNGNHRRTENQPPYYSEGDSQGKPNMSLWKAGNYKISAACYTRDGANGSVIKSGGVSVEVTLQLGDVPPPPPPPDPDPDPVPPPTTSNAFGDFALQPGSDDVQPVGSSRRISEAQLRLAGVDGLTIRARPHWNYLPFYESCLQTCAKTDDKATLLMMGGVSQTPWDDANIARYEQIANAMGARFASHPLVVGVHVCGCSPPSVSEELHWKPSDNRAYIAANKRLIDIWAQAFPKQTLLLAIGGGDPVGMREIIEYGRVRYGSRFLVKNNSMKASTTLTASHNSLVVEAGKAGCHIGWEAVGSTKESRFGGSLQQAFNNIYTLEAQAGKPRGQSYRAWYMPDLPTLGSIK